jgi:hypothetical protein
LTIDPQPAPDATRAGFEDLRVELAENHPARTARQQRYTLLAVWIVVLGALVVYLKLRTVTPPTGRGAVLALQAERHGPALRISWNRDIAVVNNASSAVLSIHDGDLQTKELHFDLEQLRNGSVVYSPTNKNVEVRLEITGPDGTKTVESVLTDVAPKANLAASQVAAGRRAAGSTLRNRKSTRPRRAEFANPPSQVASLSPEPFALIEQLVFAQPNLPTPAESQDLHQPPAFPTFIAPRPIHESLPNLPPDIRAAIVSVVEVRIKVQVDESGRAVRSDLADWTGPASDSLVSVTREAALRWRFAPAMLGTQPVTSEVAVVFRYIPKVGE